MSDAAATPAPARSARLESVDFVRGLVMVLMALDHVRDHFHRGALTMDPTNLAHGSPALFLTRWITHFCAPTFMLLAGTGAYLWGVRHTKSELRRFLVTRGLWLVLLELTLINWEWKLGPDVSHFGALVIWALGWSMVALSVLVGLPPVAIGVLGWVMIVGHNALDGVRPEQFGSLGWIWNVLHVQGTLELGGARNLFIMYPLIPWIGVMMAGYALGAALSGPREVWRARAFRSGLMLTLAFVVIRVINRYGDPTPWSAQATPLLTVCSFLNCQKYPPSMLFLFMTLGPALMLLAWAERGIAVALRPLIAFGRVPMFYYLLHLALIDVFTMAFAVARYGSRLPQMFSSGIPADWGYPLGMTYVIWLLVITALYPLCARYARFKAGTRVWWASYL
jgi:uncharacterized membrane protein